MLTVFLVIGYVVAKLTQFMIMPQIAPDQSFQMIRQLIVTTITFIGYTYLILHLNGLLSRYIRTINCLFACSIILEIITIPVILILPSTPADSTVSGQVAIAQLTAFFVLFVVAVWQIVINVFIYQQSLSVSQGRAFLIWLGLIGTQMMLFFIGGLL